jgi:hypothetical protein
MLGGRRKMPKTTQLIETNKQITEGAYLENKHISARMLAQGVGVQPQSGCEKIGHGGRDVQMAPAIRKNTSHLFSQQKGE